MFNLKLLKKKPKYFPPDRIFESNFIDPEKWKHLKGEITFKCADFKNHTHFAWLALVFVP